MDGFKPLESVDQKWNVEIQNLKQVYQKEIEKLKHEVWQLQIKVRPK